MCLPWDSGLAAVLHQQESARIPLKTQGKIFFLFHITIFFFLFNFCNSHFTVFEKFQEAEIVSPCKLVKDVFLLDFGPQKSCDNLRRAEKTKSREVVLGV